MATYNVGSADRLIRFFLAVVLFYFVSAGIASPWNWVLGIVGAVLLVSSAVGFCPLYKLLGITTSPPPRKTS